MDHGRLKGQRRSTAGLRGRAWWRDPPNPRARSDVRPSRCDGGRPEGRWRRATLPITRRGASPFRAAGHWRRNPRQPASLSDVEAHRAADSQEPAPRKRPNLVCSCASRQHVRLMHNISLPRSRAAPQQPSVTIRTRVKLSQIGQFHNLLVYAKHGREIGVTQTKIGARNVGNSADRATLTGRTSFLKR